MSIIWNFKAIGTSWQIEINEEVDNSEKLLGEIQKFIDQFDKDYSRFREDSLVTKISKKKGTYKLPVNAKLMMEFYKKLYNLTDHIVTPLIGSVMVEAGYDTNYSLVQKKLNHPPKWEEVIDYQFPNLIVAKPVLLDFGAAGKGYLVDLIGKFLLRNRIQNFCIDAGGDILYSNIKNKQLKVGLEHPDNQSQVIGTTEISNESICGSAGNRRRWGKFNHIINPLTLKSVTNIKAVWVISKTAMIADGLATALFFIKPQKLIKDFKFEYLIVYNDLSFDKSIDFKGEIFTNV